MMRRMLVLMALLWLTGCTGLPENVRPVGGFELQRYLGKWYEIARLDHPFERGLSRITADYSLRDDGGVRVINRGFAAAENDWREAEGKAYFVAAPDVGHLKVSFFGPFYGTYAIAELDPEYGHALVTGPDHDYLWILARTRELDEEVLQRLLTKARLLGYDTSALIHVAH